MNMKFLAFLLLFVSAQSVFAEALYYIGEAVVTKSDGTITREPYIIARTSDSAAEQLRRPWFPIPELGLRKTKV